MTKCKHDLAFIAPTKLVTALWKLFVEHLLPLN